MEDDEHKEGRFGCEKEASSLDLAHAALQLHICSYALVFIMHELTAQLRI